MTCGKATEYSQVIKWTDNININSLSIPLLSIDNGEQERINPFTNNLARLNLIFSFSTSVFSFALFLFLETHGIPIIYGGIGLSSGQLIALLLLFPQGRAVDKGYSFVLMIIGSLLFASLLIILYFSVATSDIFIIIVPASIAGIVAVESTFRTSLNSFISKSAKANILGSNFSRIIVAETIGSAISFAILAIGAYSSYISVVILGSGVGLFLFTVLVFFVLDSKNRDFIRSEERRTPRPGLRESISSLKGKMGFVSTLIASKTFMNVGSIAFSFFYIPTGLYLGVSPVLTFSVLLACYVTGALISRVGEEYIDEKVHNGRVLVILIMLFDLLVFGAILLSLLYTNELLFLAAAIATIPSPILISGAMAYETNVIGKEHRGLFSAVQRTVFGSTAVFVTIGLTALFILGPFLVWSVSSLSSFIALIIALMLRNPN